MSGVPAYLLIGRWTDKDRREKRFNQFFCAFLAVYTSAGAPIWPASIPCGSTSVGSLMAAGNPALL